MLSWSTILYGALMSAVLTVPAVAVLNRITTARAGWWPVALTAAAASFVGPLAWNSILRSTGGRAFFHDAPISVLPASWQDTGSGCSPSLRQPCS